VWMAGHRSLYDAMGPDFTLLRLDPDRDASALLNAARLRGIPMQLLDVEPEDRELYGEAFVLSRPDRHVAWRGDACPQDPDALLDILTGVAAR